MNERILPPLSDPRLEALVLGAMLQHARIAVDCLSTLTADAFYRPAYRLVFETIERLAESGISPETATVVGRLEHIGRIGEVGGFDAIVSLVDHLPGLTGYRSWVEALKEKQRLRFLVAAFEKGYDMLAEGESAAKIGGAFADSTQNLGGSTGTLVELGQVKRKPEKRHDKGLSTGIPLIDEETATHGAPKGQLCVALAASGVGKSTLMLQIATHAAWEQRGVFYLTMSDLNQEWIQSRVLRMRTRYSSLESARSRGEELRFISAEEEMSRVSFTIDDRTKKGSRDVDDIIDTIETVRLQRLGTDRPLTEVFVDYLQKLRSRKFDRRDSYGESVYCAGQLAQYAENSELVVWAGSQLTLGSDKHGSQDRTKGGGHWQEESAITIKVVAKEGNARKMSLPKSRFGGQGLEMDSVFNDDYLLFLPPGVQRPWL